MALREAELHIYLPVNTPQVDVTIGERFRCLPGRIAVAPDPERTTARNGILVSGEASGRLRPDCGTVVSVGPENYQGGLCLAAKIPLEVGDRVLLRPYHGVWLLNPEVRLYGVSCHWSHSILAVLRGETWVPLNDWVLIKREERSGIQIANPDNKRQQAKGTVILAGAKASACTGETVLLDTHPNSFLRFKFGLEGYELIKEIDDDGFRQIFSVIYE